MIPSATINSSTEAISTVVDSLGRRLSLRQLNALDKLRLFKAAGPELGQNPPWLGMAMLASSVVAVDDIPVPPPVNEQQIEAMVSRLGDAGLTAVSDALEATAGPPMQEAIATAGN